MQSQRITERRHNTFLFHYFCTGVKAKATSEAEEASNVEENSPVAKDSLDSKAAGSDEASEDKPDEEDAGQSDEKDPDEFEEQASEMESADNQEDDSDASDSSVAEKVEGNHLLFIQNRVSSGYCKLPLTHDEKEVNSDWLTDQ